MTSNIKKFQSLVIALVFMGSMIGLYIWMDTLVVSEGIALEKQAETISSQEEFSSQFRQLQSMVSETESEREKLETYILADDADTITLLTEIDAIAKQQNVILETNQLSVDETKGAFNTLNLSYTLEGTEEALMNMLRIFETLPYHGSIIKVSIDRKASGASPGSISADIALQLTIEDYD